MTTTSPKAPTLLQSLIPVAVLILLLFLSVKFFKDDSSYGPNQIALILCAGVAILIGIRNGYGWKELEKGMVHGISMSMGAIFILLVVGSLIGTWILSGIVPTLIYYGLHILHPTIFYLATCVVCAVIALATGSSWTTASTIGIALMGVAGAMELNLPMAAGAVISGAYFGDKLSPLSDTTNLAPAMAGTDLFTHIRHMLWTTIPSFSIACTLFLILGLTGKSSAQPGEIDTIINALEANFTIGWYLLIPPVLVLFMVMKKMPAFPALLIGALIGGLFAVFFQQEALIKYVGETDLAKPLVMIKGVWMALFTKYQAATGNAKLDDLLSRGGMQSMLDTIWLIMSAMMFGAVMEKTRMLETIANKILGLARSTGSLITATLCTSIGMNLIASDQYIAIVIPGRMFRAEFKKRRLHPKNLSRCLEDAGTLTSPMIPWNTCGAYMSANLGISAALYWPFCFFNLLNPIISSIYGFTGFSIVKLEDDELEDDLNLVA